MDNLVFALEERMQSRAWPDCWMTTSEIATELDDWNFWASSHLSGWSIEGRELWLSRALATEEDDGRAIWLRMGNRYKHFALVRQNRDDLDDYLTWVAEQRQARTRRAEELLSGQARRHGVVLHPLAPPSEECLRRAESFSTNIIAAVPDAHTAERLHAIWSIYEASRPLDLMRGLHVCRLFLAIGTVLADAYPLGAVKQLRRIITAAESWFNSLLCLAECEASNPVVSEG